MSPGDPATPEGARDTRTAAAMALALLVLGLRLAAPATRLDLWGVNGFRAVSLPERGALLMAGALVALALGTLRRTWTWAAVGILACVAIAFPLREAIHWLGDTSLRMRAIADPVPPGATWDALRHALHAAPLDAAIGYTLPRAIVQVTGCDAPTAVSVVGALLALVAMAGAWRLAGALDWRPPGARALLVVLAVAGALELFAGYAESGGVFVAGLVWWLSEVMRDDGAPTGAGWGHGLRVWIGWLLLTLAHRMALLLVPGLLVWSLARPPRRVARALVTLGVALAGVLASAWLDRGRLGGDAREWLAVSRSAGGLRAVSAMDALQLLAVTCPLLFVFPALQRRPALVAARRAPVWIALACAVPLLVVGMVQPATPSGLGAERDWDLSVPGGLLLAVAMLAWLEPPATARAARPPRVAATVVAVGAAAWLAVNASVTASVDRAVSLAYADRLPAAQRSHLFMFLGERAQQLGDPTLAAPFYEQAYALVRNPRRAIMAARAWCEAGDLSRAAQLLAEARAVALPPDLAEAAEDVARQISARRRAPSPPTR